MPKKPPPPSPPPTASSFLRVDILSSGAVCNVTSQPANWIETGDVHAITEHRVLVISIIEQALNKYWIYHLLVCIRCSCKLFGKNACYRAWFGFVGWKIAGSPGWVEVAHREHHHNRIIKIKIAAAARQYTLTRPDESKFNHVEKLGYFIVVTSFGLSPCC